MPDLEDTKQGRVKGVTAMRKLGLSLILALWASLALAQQPVPISGLPSATLPLTGTEIIPLVQSGTTKQVQSSVFLPAGSNLQVQYNSNGALGAYTNTQLTTLINTFTSTLTGAVPASGGGTVKFLRADAIWATPAGGGNVIGPVSSTTNNVATYADGTGTALLNGPPYGTTGNSTLVETSAGGTISSTLIPATAISAGSCTNCNVTFGADGRATAQANGTAIVSVGVAGDARNLVIVQASTTTLTVTADQIVMATALNGTPYLEPSVSHTFNVAATGANGLDTGSVAANTWYCIYEITKGDASTFATLGYKAVTAGTCPTIYPGANIPSGYIASALDGIWRTNGSSQFPADKQLGRKLYFAPQLIFTGTTGSATLTTQSLALSTSSVPVVPPSAKTATILMAKAGSEYPSWGISPDNSTLDGAVWSNAGVGAIQVQLGATIGAAATFPDFPLFTAQTVYWQDPRTDTDNKMYVSAFTF